MRKTINLNDNFAIGLIFAFLVNTFGPSPWAQAQEFTLPAPGQMVSLSPAFSPTVLKGIKLDPKNPFRFHFFVDTGDKKLKQKDLKSESAKLIKYFLASLTIPEKDLWVNLSPYEKDRIVPQEFGQTEMGRDLLAQDYMLKQITASLIYPESKLGKEFWQKVYTKAQAKYGTTNISINTFNKVWIVPEKAVVYENGGVAFVLENHLKVMLEQDYLALKKNSKYSSLLMGGGISTLGSQIVREIVIPALTKEVNEGKNFAQLRQVFYSLILATWYKKKIKDSILNKVYSNQNKIGGVSVLDQDKDRIYLAYLKAFKKGAFNYIKEDSDPTTNQVIPRKYFSGGVVGQITPIVQYEKREEITPSQISVLDSAQIVDINSDVAMIIPPVQIDQAGGESASANNLRDEVFRENWTRSRDVPEKVKETILSLLPVREMSEDNENMREILRPANMQFSNDVGHSNQNALVWGVHNSTLKFQAPGFEIELDANGSNLEIAGGDIAPFPAALNTYPGQEISPRCRVLLYWMQHQFEPFARTLGFKFVVFYNSTARPQPTLVSIGYKADPDVMVYKKDLLSPSNGHAGAIAFRVANATEASNNIRDVREVKLNEGLRSMMEEKIGNDTLGKIIINEWSQNVLVNFLKVLRFALVKGNSDLINELEITNSQIQLLERFKTSAMPTIDEKLVYVAMKGHGQNYIDTVKKLVALNRPLAALIWFAANGPHTRREFNQFDYEDVEAQTILINGFIGHFQGLLDKLDELKEGGKNDPEYKSVSVEAQKYAGGLFNGLLMRTYYLPSWSPTGLIKDIVKAIKGPIKLRSIIKHSAKILPSDFPGFISFVGEKQGYLEIEQLEENNQKLGQRVTAQNVFLGVRSVPSEDTDEYMRKKETYVRMRYPTGSDGVQQDSDTKQGYNYLQNLSEDDAQLTGSMEDQAMNANIVETSDRARGNIQLITDRGEGRRALKEILRRIFEKEISGQGLIDQIAAFNQKEFPLQCLESGEISISPVANHIILFRGLSPGWYTVVLSLREGNWVRVVFTNTATNDELVYRLGLFDIISNKGIQKFTAHKMDLFTEALGMVLTSPPGQRKTAADHFNSKNFIVESDASREVQVTPLTHQTIIFKPLPSAGKYNVAVVLVGDEVREVFTKIDNPEEKKIFRVESYTYVPNLEQRRRFVAHLVREPQRPVPEAANSNGDPVAKAVKKTLNEALLKVLQSPIDHEVEGFNGRNLTIESPVSGVLSLTPVHNNSLAFHLPPSVEYNVRVILTSEQHNVELVFKNEERKERAIFEINFSGDKYSVRKISSQWIDEAMTAESRFSEIGRWPIDNEKDLEKFEERLNSGQPLNDAEREEMLRTLRKYRHVQYELRQKRKDQNMETLMTDNSYNELKDLNVLINKLDLLIGRIKLSPKERIMHVLREILRKSNQEMIENQSSSMPNQTLMTETIEDADRDRAMLNLFDANTTFIIASSIVSGSATGMALILYNRYQDQSRKRFLDLVQMIINQDGLDFETIAKFIKGTYGKRAFSQLDKIKSLYIDIKKTDLYQNRIVQMELYQSQGVSFFPQPRLIAGLVRTMAELCRGRDEIRETWDFITDLSEEYKDPYLIKEIALAKGRMFDRMSNYDFAILTRTDQAMKSSLINALDGFLNYERLTKLYVLARNFAFIAAVPETIQGNHSLAVLEIAAGVGATFLLNNYRKNHDKETNKNIKSHNPEVLLDSTSEMVRMTTDDFKNAWESYQLDRDDLLRNYSPEYLELAKRRAMELNYAWNAFTSTEKKELEEKKMGRIEIEELSVIANTNNMLSSWEDRAMAARNNGGRSKHMQGQWRRKQDSSKKEKEFVNARKIREKKGGKDNAAIAVLPNGGIDFNPAQMSMQVKKEGQDFKYNLNGIEIDSSQVTGATFTIRQMTPVTNLSAILGLSV